MLRVLVPAPPLLWGDWDWVEMHPRYLPHFDMLRDKAHRALDDALRMYADGAPLWIRTGAGFTSTRAQGCEIDITIREERF